MNIVSSMPASSSSSSSVHSAGTKESTENADFQLTFNSSLQFAKNNEVQTHEPVAKLPAFLANTKKQTPNAPGPGGSEKKSEVEQHDQVSPVPNMTASDILISSLLPPAQQPVLQTMSAPAPEQSVSPDKVQIPTQAAALLQIQSSSDVASSIRPDTAQALFLSGTSEVQPAKAAVLGDKDINPIQVPALAHASQVQIPQTSTAQTKVADGSLVVALPTSGQNSKDHTIDQQTNMLHGKAAEAASKQSTSGITPEVASQGIPPQPAPVRIPPASTSVLNPEGAHVALAGGSSAGTHGQQQQGGKQDTKAFEATGTASITKPVTSHMGDATVPSAASSTPVPNGTTSLSAAALSAATSTGSQSLHPAPAMAAASPQNSVEVPSGTMTSPHVALSSAPSINSARVLESMSGTEMRVGMHSTEFGSVSIATSISPGGVAAQIVLDHGALGRALAAHLPNIEEKLGNALGLTARVEVRDTGVQSSAGESTDFGGRGTSQGSSKEGRNGNEIATDFQQKTNVPYGGMVSVEGTEEGTGSTRLNVRA